MKIAITDACIFIDLYDLNLNTAFFKLDLEIHTSVDVFNELYPEQQQVLLAFQSLGKLIMHSISEEDRIKIIATPYPRSLSEIDKTVLYLAAKANAMILSSDKAVRQYGKGNSILYHGMLWIFDQLIAEGILHPNEASVKLNLLIQSNVIYQHSAELCREMDIRLKRWEKLVKSMDK
jgi:hypothetical protein